MMYLKALFRHKNTMKGWSSIKLQNYSEDDSLMGEEADKTAVILNILAYVERRTSSVNAEDRVPPTSRSWVLLEGLL